MCYFILIVKYYFLGAINLKLKFFHHGRFYTVPKEINFPRYKMKCSGETRYCAEYFMYIVQYWSISFSSTFHVISRKFGLLFGQCRISIKFWIVWYPTWPVSSQTDLRFLTWEGGFMHIFGTLKLKFRKSAHNIKKLKVNQS